MVGSWLLPLQVEPLLASLPDLTMQSQHFGLTLEAFRKTVVGMTCFTMGTMGKNMGKTIGLWWFIIVYVYLRWFNQAKVQTEVADVRSLEIFTHCLWRNEPRIEWVYNTGDSWAWIMTNIYARFMFSSATHENLQTNHRTCIFIIYCNHCVSFSMGEQTWEWEPLGNDLLLDVSNRDGYLELICSGDIHLPRFNLNTLW